MIPAALVLCIFSTEVIWAWTGEVGLTSGASVILAVLAVGWGLNGVQNAPYALLLAHGWTNFVLVANIATAIVFLPSIALLASVYGAVGAAIAWMVFNIAMLGIAVPLMHRRLLKGEAGRWFLIDLGRPLVISGAIGGIAWWTLGSSDLSRVGSVLTVVSVYGLTLAAMIVFVPWLRQETLRIATHLQLK